MPDVFLDSSAVFAAIVSTTGGARQILRLGEVGQARLLVSGAVLSEVERTLREKLPEQLATLALWLDAARVTVAVAPRRVAVTRLRNWLSYAPDALVLAAAVSAEVDFFVTLDRKHFLSNAPLRAALLFPLGTPGDYLAWHRARFTPAESPPQ
jgi:predicted nucleic acid-binding protein